MLDVCPFTLSLVMRHSFREYTFVIIQNTYRRKTKSLNCYPLETLWVAIQCDDMAFTNHSKWYYKKKTKSNYGNVLDVFCLWWYLVMGHSVSKIIWHSLIIQNTYILQNKKKNQIMEMFRCVVWRWYLVMWPFVSWWYAFINHSNTYSLWKENKIKLCKCVRCVLFGMYLVMAICFVMIWHSLIIQNTYSL